ncbi:MAG: hypothetical protein H6Q33_3676 [Deltaproteobacteria bacterium]|nr:hypothetical protein [Deltaproteobacteria bacterium]
MIVIAKKVGRLANRLLLFAHFIGTAVEHGFSVANPAFASYARYFPATARDLFCRFPPRRSVPSHRLTRESLYRGILLTGGVLHWLQRHGRDVGLIRLRRDQSLDLNSTAFLSVIRRHRIVLVQDWFFRSPHNLMKHRDVIRSYFTPWEHHLVRARAIVSPARERQRFLVGVHVRRGDYNRFKGGRFFYSYLQYRRVMESVQAAFPAERVSFLVCSDAPVPPGAFAGFDVLYGNGHELEDLYALAACDRLIGPPSTYSMWASFYGGVPRYEIVDPAAQRLEVRAFRVESGLAYAALPSVPGGHS